WRHESEHSPGSDLPWHPAATREAGTVPTCRHSPKKCLSLLPPAASTALSHIDPGMDAAAPSPHHRSWDCATAALACLHFRRERLETAELRIPGHDRQCAAFADLGPPPVDWPEQFRRPARQTVRRL